MRFSPPQLVTTAVVAVLAAALTITVVAAQQGGQDQVQLRAAIKKESVDGDLKGAIAIYQQLRKSADRAVVAEALVRMGQCYEKLGAAESAEARKAYEEVVGKFADQTQPAADARARLAALGAGTTAAATPLSPPGTLRRLYHGPAFGQFSYVTGDGRYVLARMDSEFAMYDLAAGFERRVPHASTAVLASEWIGAVSPPPIVSIASPDLSPDRRQLAYSVILSHRSSGRIQSQIRLVSVDGTNDRIVVKQDGVSLVELRWTSDGKSLVVARFADPSDKTKMLGKWVLMSVRVADGAITNLSAEISPADGDYYYDLSPDGRFLLSEVLSHDGDIGRVVLIDARTGARAPISDLADMKTTGAGWAPDGHGIYVRSRGNDGMGIWFLRVENGVPQGRPQLLRADLATAPPATIGSDGSYYYVQRTQTIRHYVVSVDKTTGQVASAPAPLPELENACGYGWSPDGTSLAYAARFRKGPDPRPACSVIVLRSIADGRERILSPGFDQVQLPQWSPDGRSLVAFGRRDGVIGRFRIDPETNTARLLVGDFREQGLGEDARATFWAPDGRGLFLGRLDGAARNGVFRLVHKDLETGAESDRFVTKSPGWIWFASTSVSPDGSLCVRATEDNRTFSAFVIPPDGTPPRAVYTPKAGTGFNWVAWAPDGKSLYAITRRLQPPEARTTRDVVRIPLEGGDPVPTGLTFLRMNTLSPSPDGTRLLFSTSEDIDEVWVYERLVPTGAAAAPAKK